MIMKGKSGLIKIGFIFLFVLVLSAFRTVTARADDATPPPTATPEVTQPTDDGSTTGTQVAPTEAATPVPTEETVVQAVEPSTSVEPDTATPSSADTAVAQEADVSAPVDTSAAAAAPAQASGDAGPASTDANPQLISQVPPGSKLVLLSDQQPAIPLGSVEAANILAGGDPIWCPTGVAPRANTGGCTNTFSFFNGAFLTALTGKTTSGTIWIISSYAGGEAVTLDSGLGTTWNYALTLQGGWNGTPGSTTIIGSSTFTKALAINWNADVTLKNITVTGVTSGTALSVTTPKNITLTGVKVNTNHAAAGAVLNNTNGGTGTGNVNVASSQFNDNTGGTGLRVSSMGTITLSAVMADTNGGIGADLGNNAATSAKNVTLTSGPYEFDDNTSLGLRIYSKGAIALKDIDALGNSQGGAYLDNTFAATAQGITLTGSNIFSENNQYGLYANSHGTIATNNLVANANANYWGVLLDNSTASSAQAVTLTGSSNQFNSNWAGLEIYSKGNITLNSITASHNWGDPGSAFASGAYLDTCTYDGVHCTVSGNVTLTGTNSFEDNHYTGFKARSGGTITISNLSADGNSTGYGASLNNAWSTSPKNITLTGTNSFSDNYLIGLYGTSLGAIALSNVTANNNQTQYGGYLVASGSLIMSGINTFNNNGLHGLYAQSNGAISLTSLDAENNGSYGAILSNTGASTPQSVKLTGTNKFDGNSNDGLVVTSNGAITLNNAEASSNHLDGVQLINNTSAAPQAITVSGTLNVFSNNSGGYGLNIQTKGAVTIANLTASGNHSDGAHINNQVTTASPQNVTLTGSNTLSNNGDSGLYILTYGAIAMNNLTASGNGLIHASSGGGAYLDTCAYDHISSCPSPLAKSITLTGINTFQDNYSDGLTAFSKGPIKVNALTADWNGVHGASLMNQWGAGSSGGITLTGSNTFRHNGYVGLGAASQGAISVNNLTANDNSDDGVWLSTDGLTTPQSVTITGSNTFLNNGNVGLVVWADGNISLNSVTANGNGGGASLDNCFWSGSHCNWFGTLTLTGTNTFSNNTSGGLYFKSHKNVTINHIEADENGAIGVDGLTDGGSITVLGGSLTHNTSYGWQLKALTTVTLKGVFAYGNRGGVLPENNLLGGSLVIVRTYP
jgi:hypothetical protein